MTPTEKNTLLSFCAAATFAVGSSLVWATPAITGIQSPAITELTQGSTITITGSGFGSKPQAAPILYDTVDAAYENGVLNPRHSQLSNGDLILGTNENPDSIWAGPSNTAFGSSRVQVTSDRPTRHANSSEHYYFKGFNGFVGKPVAYGGKSGFDTPVDEPQLYVSWWYKPKYSPSLYWRIDPLNQEGTFVPGEKLAINGNSATFIGIDDEGMINLAFDNLVNSNNLKGQLLRGSQSNATTIFPDIFKGGGDFGYLDPGSQKYLRIREDANGKIGIALSWTQMHQSLSGYNTSDVLVNWAKRVLEGNQWHFMEFMIDTNKGTFKINIDAQPLTSFNFDPKLAFEGEWSPTVALLGLNGKVGHLQESDFDDIYIDNSFQRVIIADSKNIQEAGYTEVQYPTSWSDTAIKFQLNKGSLPEAQEIYVFVSNRDGDFNLEGYPLLCEDCSSPPARIEINVD